MLRLGRRIGERVIITTPGGERIVVMVAATSRDRAVLAFDAHPDVTIDREEVDNIKTRRKAGGA
jgi:sRNA-binding carbon storage regulator CsrA